MLTSDTRLLSMMYHRHNRPIHKVFIHNIYIARRFLQAVNNTLIEIQVLIIISTIHSSTDEQD